MSTSDHLTHLLALLAPPYREAWRAYCWNRAKEIAKNKEHADLPRLLEEAMKSGSSREYGTPGGSS